MITNGESKIKKVIAINYEGKALAPCGACRELMTQLMPNDYKEIEIMNEEEFFLFLNKRIDKLGQLTPEWWI